MMGGTARSRLTIKQHDRLGETRVPPSADGAHQDPRLRHVTPSIIAGHIRRDLIEKRALMRLKYFNFELYLTGLIEF